MPPNRGLICSWHVHHKTPFVRFPFGPTPLYSGPAQQVYVLEGPSVSVGRQTEMCLQRTG